MKFDITRAWKDETYRQTLSDEERTLLPANPAGEMELNEQDLVETAGGLCPPPGFGFPLIPVLNNQHALSLSVAICNTNVFSTNVGAAAVASLVPVTQTCVFQG